MAKTSALANNDLRYEIWCFEIVKKAPGDKPVYKRLPFNFVTYDGDPEELLEPVSDVAWTEPGQGLINLERLPQVIGFRFFEGNPFPNQVHQFR